MKPPHLAWKETEDGLKPVLEGDGVNPAWSVAWGAQNGSQQCFLALPTFEVLYEGTRGPGKTAALIADFCQHVGADDRTTDQKLAGVPKRRGWGTAWRGILFRRTFPELQDVVDKSKEIIPLIFPGAVFNEGKHFWTFPDGEKLFFRQFDRDADYWKYHGHAYPWIAWEELGNWPSDRGYRLMMSCARSPVKGIPIKVRATTNPFGVGHNWVKIRFRLPLPPGHWLGPLIDDSKDENGQLEPPRRVVHGELRENRVLMTSDPGYPTRLVQSAPNEAAVQAWVFGSWDIVAGGMFDDVWVRAKKWCIVPPFKVPEHWRIDRSFDWGDAVPFSVGWWAESNGEDLEFPDGSTMSTVRGDIFRIGEWYGWTGKPNTGIKMVATDVAKGIIQREVQMGIRGRVRPGPADGQIFGEINGNSIANDMKKAQHIGNMRYKGVTWTMADKSKGTRKLGWQLIRSRLAATVPSQGAARERPGLFIVQNCRQWLRTVPVLPRDEKDPYDVDSKAEDHIGDETRYRLLAARTTRRTGRTAPF